MRVQNRFRLPNWLRWILLLPLAFLLEVIAFWLVGFITHMVILLAQKLIHYWPPGDIRAFLSIIGFSFQHIVSAFVFIYSGVAVAPQYKFPVAIFLTVTFSVIITIEMILLSYYLEGTAGAGIHIAYFALLGVLAALFACYRIRQKAIPS